MTTSDVLAAAETKWNFLPFKPGLVGGHCIGVDPYYLTHKATQFGFKPEVILAGRNVNDGMATEVVRRVFHLMEAKRIKVPKANILILGLSFKENCPDMRNSKVFEIVKLLQDSANAVDVYDPHINVDELPDDFNGHITDLPQSEKYDAIIVAVAHEEFKSLGAKSIKALGKPNHVFFDLKSIFNSGFADGQL